MKRTQLIALSVLALGFQGAVYAMPSDGEGNYNLQHRGSYAESHAGTPGASASVFPSDAEASYSMPANTGNGIRFPWGASAAAGFPSDAEASYSLPARSTFADRHAGEKWTSASVPFPSDAEAQIPIVAVKKAPVEVEGDMVAQQR